MLLHKFLLNTYQIIRGIQQRISKENVLYAYHVLCLINLLFIVELYSLAARICNCNIKSVIFKILSKGDILSISCDIALWWILQEDLADDLSTSEYVMAYHRYVTSHYLSQCWPQIAVDIWRH